MIIKNKGYERKFIYGGANIFTPLWNLAKRAFSFIAPRALDFGKKKAVDLATKGAETLGKKAAKKVTETAKSKINKLLASKTKSGINGLVSTDPSKIGLEAPKIDKPLNVDSGINMGLNRGLGIKII